MGGHTRDPGSLVSSLRGAFLASVFDEEPSTGNLTGAGSTGTVQLGPNRWKEDHFDFFVL